MTILIIIITLPLLMILLFLLILNMIKSKIFKDTKELELINDGSDLILFTYNNKTNILNFNKRYKLFNNSKFLNFDNFIPMIISDNKNQVKSIFNLKNKKSSTSINIVIKKLNTYLNYILSVKKTGEHVFFCSMKNALDIQINLQNTFSKKHEIAIREENYSNMILKMNEFWNEEKNNKNRIFNNNSYYGIFYIRIDNIDLLRKYYSRNLLPKLSNKISSLLNKRILKGEFFTQYDDYDFVIFKSNIGSKFKAEKFLNNYLNYLNKNLIINNISFNLKFRSGIYIFNDILDIISPNEAIDVSKSALYKAKELNIPLKIVVNDEVKNYFDKEHKDYRIHNILKNNHINISFNPINNSLDNKLLGEIVLINNIDSKVSYDSSFNDDVIDYYFRNNDPDGLVNIFNKYLKNKRREYFIILDFETVSKNIFFWYNFAEKSIYKISILLKNYFFSNIDDVIKISNQLAQKSIKCGLYSFDFFYNSINIIAGSSIKYIILKRKVMDKLVDKTWSQNSVKLLNILAKNKKIIMIAHDIKNIEEFLLSLKLKIPYYTGNLSKLFEKNSSKSNINLINHYKKIYLNNKKDFMEKF